MRTKTPVSRARFCESPYPAVPLSARMPITFTDMNGADEQDERGSDSEDEKETCIRCDKGGQVLECSSGDCPLAVHKKCLLSKPRFDDLGNFLCPYCWYKHAVEKKREWKNLAMLAKKELWNFVRGRVIVVNDGPLKENGVNLRHEKDNGTSTGEQNDHDDTGRENGGEDEVQDNPSNTAEKTDGKHGEIEEEVRNHEAASEGTVLSTRQKIPEYVSDMDEASDSDLSDSDSSDSDYKNQNKQFVPLKRRRDIPESSKRKYIETQSPRKRARWTEAEENLLKQGVQQFSSQVNKNFPWRKVLEFGNDVFHPNRNPTDLKDKWKNMIKAASTDGKKVLL